MARIRTIKPEFFRSRSLARCSRDARMTFAGMWCDADAVGRGVAETRILKGAIWPLDDDITPETIADHLAELAGEHITLYEIDGELFYEIMNWEKHQAASYRQGEAKFPPPSAGTVCTSSHATCTPERAVREGKGREGKVTAALPHAPPPTANPGPEFDEFWDTYPRKSAKAKAQTSWNRLGKSERLKALAALPAHCTMWGRGDPSFIPHGSTWLNGKRWDDELTFTGPKPRPDGLIVTGAI